MNIRQIKNARYNKQGRAMNFGNSKKVCPVLFTFLALQTVHLRAVSQTRMAESVVFAWLPYSTTRVFE
ncbi:MAG: hypothetical protein HY356_03225 [Gammaproteobacteria bacterium]|nr:hypothetical protein [Gammaproteobacteria bacterium]